MWDDEENVIQEGAPQAEEEGEDEISLDEAPEEVAEEAAQEADAEADSKMDSDSEHSDLPKMRQRRVKAVNSQSSSVKAKKVKAFQAAKGFFDEEAELGSDDENKVDARKHIDKDDQEENEDGLDSDLDGFVAKGDEVEVGDAEEGALNKFM